MDTTERVELKEREKRQYVETAGATLSGDCLCIFAIFGRNFFSYTNLVNILDSSYYIGFIAIGSPL